MIYITDAYQGEPHVYADHIGNYNIGVMGYSGGYFPDVYGFSFKTEILSNNKVRIKTGYGMIGGRRFAVSGFEDVVLESGATGENRIDVIYFVHNQNSDGKESIYLEVSRGTPTSGTPTYIDHSSVGAIPAIAGDYLMAAFLVRFEGVNIISVEKHEGFRNLRSIRNVYEYASERTKQLEEAYLPLQIKYSDVLKKCEDMEALIGGTAVSFNLVLYSYTNNNVDETEYYAGGYTVRQAKRQVIAGRCFLDIWVTINSLGNIGTGERILRIRGVNANDIPKAGSGIYSASIGYISGMANSANKPTALIAPGAQYISLFLNGDYLKAKDITAGFQVRLSVSYDMA